MNGRIGMRWHNQTRKERRIEELDDDLKVIELFKDGRDVIGNEAEDYFRAWVKGRHGHKIMRGGWPDFPRILKTHFVTILRTLPRGPG